MHELFSSSGMDYMKTFNKLSSYDVDFQCEKIYVAMEQFLTEHKLSRNGKLPFSLADFRHLYMKGMRDFFCDMMMAQKNSFEHYIEAMRESSYMPKELSPEEVEQHRQAFMSHGDQEERKDSDPGNVHGLKMSAGGRK